MILRKFTGWAAVCSIPMLIHAGAAQAVEAPTCTGSDECEQLWSRARNNLNLVSNMRIRLLTDSRIETYAPNSYSSMGAVVDKQPIGSGAYRVTINLECFRGVECNSLRTQGAELFYMMITDLAKKTPPPVSPEASTPPQPAALAAPLPSDGTRWSSKAADFVRYASCNTAPKANLVGQGPKYEAYAFACTDGDTMLIRCESGICRVLN